MLDNKSRLSNRNAVRRASRYGKQVKYAELSLRHIDNNANTPRLAVVVSKKVSKSAVKRNRIRRRVIESYRQNYADKVKGSYDLVIFAHNDHLITKSSTELTSDIGSLLNKAELI